MRWRVFTPAGLALTALMIAPGLPGIYGADGARAADLESAVRSALDYQPRVAREVAFARAAEKRIDEAYSGYLPTIDLDVAAGGELTNSPTSRALGLGTRQLVRREATATLSQMVFDGLETQHLVASRRADARATSFDTSETAERVAVETVQVFLDVLRNQSFVSISEANVAYHEQVTDLIRGRLEAGRGSEADVALAESRLFLAQATLEERRGDLRDAQARYVESVGEEAAALELPNDPPVPTTIDDALSTAMDQNPIVNASAHRADGRAADIGVADAAFMPRIDIEVTGRTGADLDGVSGIDQDLNARARLRWNLLNGGGDRARYQRAEHLRDAAKGSLGEERRRVREEVRVAWESLTTAQDRVPPLLNHVSASERVLAGYQQQFDVGRRSLLDLLDVQNELFNAQTNLTDAEFALSVSRYDLLFTTGQLLPTLGVLVDDQLTTPNWVKD